MKFLQILILLAFILLVPFFADKILFAILIHLIFLINYLVF